MRKEKIATEQPYIRKVFKTLQPRLFFPPRLPSSWKVLYAANGGTLSQDKKSKWFRYSPLRFVPEIA